MTAKVLQVESYVSAVDPSFWFAFAHKKVDVLRLDESSIPIAGYYRPGNDNTRLSLLSVTAESLDNKM